MRKGPGSVRHVLTGLRGALFAFALALLPAPALASVDVGISVAIAPPTLPVYAQPPVPVDGYIWTPGYWAWGADGYYWVPGIWVAPPAVGLLWTPGYWGFADGLYVWNAGYWGPEVGFYGGIDYGFGYDGVGFVGGAWRGGVFRYNTAVANVDRRFVRNTYYDRRAVRTASAARPSFNGPGGANARPTAAQRAALPARRHGATSSQLARLTRAARDPAQCAWLNHGRPAIAALDRIHGHAYDASGHALAARQFSRVWHGAVTRRSATLARSSHPLYARQYGHSYIGSRHATASRHSHFAGTAHTRYSRGSTAHAFRGERSFRFGSSRGFGGRTSAYSGSFGGGHGFGGHGFGGPVGGHAMSGPRGGSNRHH